MTGHCDLKCLQRHKLRRVKRFTFSIILIQQQVFVKHFLLYKNFDYIAVQNFLILLTKWHISDIILAKSE